LVQKAEINFQNYYANFWSLFTVDFKSELNFQRKMTLRPIFFLLVKNHVKSLPKKKQINFGVIFFGRLMPKNKTKKIRQKLMDYA